MGKAMPIATITIFVKSVDNKRTMPKVLAPNTFRMPISFVRRWAEKVTKPNKPKQEIKREHVKL